MAFSWHNRYHAGADGHEISGMISALTGRPRGLGREDGSDGSIVVLAGENKGSVTTAKKREEMADTHGLLRADETVVGAFTNSNYQAVNNSINLGGSCMADDPGVHIAICESFDDDDDDYSEGDEIQKTKKHDAFIEN